MNDLISRQMAIELCDWYEHDFCECDYVIRSLADDLKSLPTAEKRGEWIGIDDEPCEVWECDKCGHIVEVDATLKLPNYCENCGARMEES